MKANYGTGKGRPPKTQGIKSTAGTASGRITAAQTYSSGRKKGL